MKSRISRSKSQPALRHDLSNMYGALWMMRLMIDSTPSFRMRDAQDFLTVTADYLVWSKETFTVFLEGMELEAHYREELSGLAAQKAWAQISDDVSFELTKGLQQFAKFNRQLLRAVLSRSVARLTRMVSCAQNPIFDNIRMLQKLLPLSNVDCALLNFAALMSQSQLIRRFLTGVQTRSFDDSVHVLSILLREESVNVSQSLKSNSPLCDFHLLEVDRSPSDLAEVITIPHGFRECLCESHESLDDLMSHFIQPAGLTKLQRDDFPHLDADHVALTDFLFGASQQDFPGVNILIHGEPGTGKTEFVKVLARHSGRMLYEVAHTNRQGTALSREERLVSLRMSQQFLTGHKNALLLFDEIEDVFPDAGDSIASISQRRRAIPYGKAWMNRTLESNPIPVVWVSNSIQQIDPAYLRRFSYHLEVRKPPMTVRHRIAERYLETTAVSPEFIRQIAEESALTPAVIENAARFISLSAVGDCHTAEKLASRVIRQCQQAMGQEPGPGLRNSPTRYSLDYLSVDSRYPLGEIISALKRNPSSSLCFYGLPGTGKTALAEHIADELGQPLLIKRASDLLGKWLGESEKNIAAMFREAKTEQAILFLDEADSFLRNREKAQRNWEVNQVNELLQQMERFDGIFICATNLFGALDPAALRRFAFKIAFKAMMPEQRMRMFIQEALGNESERLDDPTRARLRLMDNLVPGDFAVVKRQMKVLGNILTPGQFLDELESECRLKSGSATRAIGFTA